MSIASLTVCLVTLSACGDAQSEQDDPVTAAPYVYVGDGRLGLARAAERTPLRRFVLAFLLSHQSRCEPVWNTGRPLADAHVLAEARALRATGAAVTVASGGASGTYLENTCATAGELADAYVRALDRTGADWLDVDIETGIPVQLVAEALREVQDRRGARISVTVEVLDERRGLPASATELLRALAWRNVDVVVNAMVMNFPPDNGWRVAMLRAAESVTDQIGQIWPSDGRDGAYRRLGLTYMAGRNDTGVVTTLADARALRDYAGEHDLAYLGFWSLARDNGRCPGERDAREDCSGLAQHTYDFARATAHVPEEGE
ncbi:carbohydrate-binding protein CenC [Prauserella oleivorans]|uniref:Carbohydrate-binding protein CenC n=1 Tax=Prauserella oleivorans TaxID=1478153 RepID=A0ABW5WLA7_9PSEU